LKKGPWCEACLKLYKSLPQRHLQAYINSPVAPLTDTRNYHRQLNLKLCVLKSRNLRPEGETGNSCNYMYL